MIGYTSTPDYYRDYIEHGWLKDQAAKAHKYIERWRGKNGKWYYRYKSKAQELGTKVKQKIDNVRTDVPGMYENDRGYSSSIKRSRYMNSKDGSRVNAGLTAGRKRVKKLGVKGQHQKRDDLRSRGYSSSFGSATSFGNHVTNRNWRHDRDAQNWADVYSGRKTFDQYKKTSSWDDSQSSGSMKDVRAGIYAGRKRRRKKK